MKKHTCDRRTPFPTHLMHQMLRTLSILVLIILLSVFGTAPSGYAGTISYGGMLSDKNGTAIGQATVEVFGANPPITTQTNASGVFDLQGVPAGNPFALKFSRTNLGTYSNGRFLIANAPEDTVLVQAFTDGWSFEPEVSHIFIDSVANQAVEGSPTASNITFAGYAKDRVNAALPGVAVQMVGNDAVTATTDGSGYFNLAGLPNDAVFFMKYSKAGYIPVYTSGIRSTLPISEPLTSGATLYTNSQFPVVAGKSAIMGLVANRTTGGPVGGAVVTLHSAYSPSGNAYVVNYCDNAGVCSAMPARMRITPTGAHLLLLLRDL